MHVVGTNRGREDRGTDSAQGPKHNNQREGLAGLVERVTFHNPENGFCVLRVKARGQRCTGQQL